jgi:hypothetical protein
MKPKLLGLTLMAAAIIYSSLQLIEPEHVRAYGKGCCFSNYDCGGASCYWCGAHCSPIGSNYGYCNAEACAPP